MLLYHHAAVRALLSRRKSRPTVWEPLVIMKTRIARMTCNSIHVNYYIRAYVRFTISSVRRTESTRAYETQLIERICTTPRLSTLFRPCARLDAVREDAPSASRQLNNVTSPVKVTVARPSPPPHPENRP